MDRPDHHRRGRGLEAPSGPAFAHRLWPSLTLICLLCSSLLLSGCTHKVVVRGRLNERAVKHMAQKISQGRGLQFKTQVRVRLQGSADLRRAARREGQGAKSDRRSVLKSQVLAMLGMIERAEDLAVGTEAMLASQPGGVYLPQASRLHIFDRPHVKSEIIEALSLFMGRDLTFGEIVAHELTHALQDQNFGLDPPDLARNNDDARLAHAALVEGDAFLAGFDLGLGGLLAEASEFISFAENNAPGMGQKVPGYLSQRFMFPYLAGGRFALSLRRSQADQSDPWQAINRAHRHPPLSSEQILHPEKYIQGDDPPRLPMVTSLKSRLPGFEQVYTDTLGEFGIRALFLRRHSPGRAAQMADGWGGDRLALYRKPSTGQEVLVWIVDWDTAGDAAAFFEGLERSCDHRFGPPDQSRWAENRYQGSQRERYLALEHQRVIYLDGPRELDLYPLVTASQSLGPGREQKHIRPPKNDQAQADLPLEQAIVIDPKAPRHESRGPGVHLGTESLGLTLGGLLAINGVRGQGDRVQGLSVSAARLNLNARVAQGLDLSFDLGLALEEEVELLRDARISFAPISPHLAYVGHFRIGRMKPPISRFRLRQIYHQPMVDRPHTAQLWAPERRVGMTYDLDLGRHQLPLHVQVGAFDGHPETSGQGPLMCARAAFSPSLWLPKWLELELAGAWMWDRGWAPDDITANVDRRGFVLDGRLRAGPVFVEGELFWLDQDPQQDLERFAWSVTSGLSVLSDFMTISARYETLNRVAVDLQNTRLSQLSAGLVMHYLGDRFLMMFNSIWRKDQLQGESTQHVLRFLVRI